jgi:hypothetical protein
MGRAWHAIRTQSLRCAAWFGGAAALTLAAWWALIPIDTAAQDPASPATGGSWPTFHGGPDRCGVAAPTDAPLGPRARWKFCDALALERRPLACSPAVAAARVVIGSDNYKCYAVDLESGRLLWTFEARWPIFSSPAISDGRVYLGEGLHENTDSKFYCLDLACGKVLWSIQTRSHTESSPSVAGGKVYFGAGDDGVYCADAPSPGRGGGAGP